jgi:hypothetical protein
MPDFPVMNASVLDREMFSEAEASRLLRVPQSTLHWWLDGGTYRNRSYRPVIRTDPTSGRSVHGLNSSKLDFCGSTDGGTELPSRSYASLLIA